MIVSSNYGRVYRPKSTDRLILHIKDINLVRPDKWGTAMLTAWIQQVSNLIKLKEKRVPLYIHVIQDDTT